MSESKMNDLWDNNPEIREACDRKSIFVDHPNGLDISIKILKMAMEDQKGIQRRLRYVNKAIFEHYGGRVLGYKDSYLTDAHLIAAAIELGMDYKVSNGRHVDLPLSGRFLRMLSDESNPRLA